MAYLADGIDAHLAEAAGENPELFHELRLAFVESAARQIDLMGRSRCDGNWHVAAMRLKGLAASFHAEELMDLAARALESAPGDPVILRHLRDHLLALSPD